MIIFAFNGPNRSRAVATTCTARTRHVSGREGTARARQFRLTVGACRRVAVNFTSISLLQAQPLRRRSIRIFSSMRIAKIPRSMRQLFDASRSWPRGRESEAFLGHACTSFSRSSLIQASTHRRRRCPVPSTRLMPLESPTLRLLTESAAHWPTLHGLLSDGRITGAQVHDARVAALCRQNGVRELWSPDRTSAVSMDSRWSTRWFTPADRAAPLRPSGRRCRSLRNQP